MGSMVCLRLACNVTPSESRARSFGSCTSTHDPDVLLCDVCHWLEQIQKACPKTTHDAREDPFRTLTGIHVNSNLFDPVSARRRLGNAAIAVMMNEVMLVVVLQMTVEDVDRSPKVARRSKASLCAPEDLSPFRAH